MGGYASGDTMIFSIEFGGLDVTTNGDSFIGGGGGSYGQRIGWVDETSGYTEHNGQGHCEDTGAGYMPIFGEYGYPEFEPGFEGPIEVVKL